MSGHRYQPVHDQDDGGSIYPPTSRIADSELAHGPPFPLKRSSHWPSKMTIGKWAVGSMTALVIFYYAILGAFSHRPGTISSQLFDQTYRNASLQPTYGAGNSSSPGAFYRDAYPIKTMLAFWSIAEQEVADKKLDTCGDQMGSGLIEAYHRSLLKFCGQGSEDVPQLSALQTTQETTEVPDSGIWCAPVHHDDFSKWWPYPAAPCLSTNIRATKHDGKLFKTVGCDVTAHGEELVAEMGREQFLGNNIEKTEQRECKEVVKRTLVVIGRQDQWNPFHVAEDLITTMVSIFIMARSAPDLINTRVQLVFSEGYGMDANHFTALWDRIGAWAPRRLSLDPWGDDVCLSNTIHSVGAGASLLSATGISRSYSCASTITWAASHYYRHLFGLPKMASKNPRRPLNVLWLSRSKLDIYAQDHNDWSSWRDVRHINNEKQLTDRLARGLREACEGDSLGRRCVFQDARDEPEVWTSQGFDESTDSFPVRFASIDPTVHALETQINYVGQSSILISSHGGALGLSLFLPPGLATVIELQVEAVKGNFHFQHMAAQTGQNYEVVEISRDVDVEQVWGALQRWVWRMAQL